MTKLFIVTAITSIALFSTPTFADKYKCSCLDSMLDKIESTKDLNVEEFSELLDSIIRFSATLGFVVEDPRKS